MNHVRPALLVSLASLLAGLACPPVFAAPPPPTASAETNDSPAARAPYRSPWALAWSPDSSTLAVADRTAARLVLLDPAAGAIREVALRGEPRAVVWRGRDEVLVAEYDAASLARVDPRAGLVTTRLPTGPKTAALALTPDGASVLVTDFALDQVAVIDLASGFTRARLPVARQPMSIAVTPDGAFAVVGNLLPETAATDPATASAVSLLDLRAGAPALTWRLPPGSTHLKSVALSPNGRLAFAAHNLGRVGVPTTQLDRGWINTNAVTVLDLTTRAPLATVLLDQVTRGSADPWGLATDGHTLWVVAAGSRELLAIDLEKLLPALAPATTPAAPARPGAAYADASIPLAQKLSFLDDLGAVVRHPLPVEGPRALALSPDGRTLAVAGYFSGAVALMDLARPGVFRVLALPDQPAPDAARRGEQLFHSALNTYQQWLSCATCHFEARADGMNWDLLNDGMGNPKNARSLLLAHRTPPNMTLGVREDYHAAVRAGFRFIGHTPTPAEITDLEAYLESLRPEPSPLLENGQPSAAALRGRALFNGKASCRECHTGELFTDLKRHDLGTARGRDTGQAVDTPTLREIWRTAPYLHDGRAATLEEIFTRHNPDGLHGDAADLTPAELDDLVAYLRSL